MSIPLILKNEKTKCLKMSKKTILRTCKKTKCLLSYIHKRQNVLFRKEVNNMLITEELAEKVRSKRGKLDFTKTRTALALNITRGTLAKIEQGNYDAPKRIYQSVMEWLIED